MTESIKSVSLALSGGGARGAVHLGVLQAMDEYNIKIEAISGTSIGSIIGALYSSGLSPKQLKDMFNTQSFRKILQFSWGKEGVLNMTKLIKLLSTLITDNDFKKLNIPFYSCVSNLNKGEYEILQTGDLFKSIAASASIPVLFAPIEINGEYYLDGGLFNNLPIEPLLKNHKNIVGVHVNNYQKSYENDAKSNAEKIFTHVIALNVAPKLSECDFVINPFIKKHVGVLDFESTDYLFNIGYKEACRLIEDKFRIFDKV